MQNNDFKIDINATGLDLSQRELGDAGEAAILLAVKNNPLFLTRIFGLINSDAINAAVDANRQLKMTAKVGVLSLVDNHNFPEAVAVMVAGYVNGEDITEQNIKSIRDDKEVEALLAPAALLSDPSTPEVAPAESGSFAPSVQIEEVASGDDGQNRADEMSRGPGL